MPENAPRGPELLTMMLKIAMVVVVVFFLIYMFAIFRAKTEGRFLERNAYQLGEGIYFQQTEKFVFEKDMLDALKDKKDEFFSRSCDSSYLINIKDMITNDEWSFGYEPDSDVILNSKTITLPTAIIVHNPEKSDPLYDDADISMITLTVYDTYTSRLSCTVEKAFLSKEIQSMRIPCLFSGQNNDCKIEITNINGKICIKNPTDPDPIDCRISPYTIVPINEEYNAVKVEGRKISKKILRAYPLKSGADCETIKTDSSFIASKNDPVSEIKLCLEDLP